MTHATQAVTRRRLLANAIAVSLGITFPPIIAVAKEPGSEGAHPMGMSIKVGKYAITVNGTVPGEALGITLPHEHVILDFTTRYSPIENEQELQTKPTLESRWRLLRHPAAHKLNLVGTDIQSAITEGLYFKAAGGHTIVDLTAIGLSPDPVKLKKIAETTGLNIIAATGYYVDPALPDWVRSASVDELADRLIDDIETGGREKIRRGAIGEIAIEGHTELEIKCVRAAGKAQARTGAPCFFHVMSGILPDFRSSTEDVINLYLREGGDIRKLVLCHQDGSGIDLNYQKKLLKRGLWIMYDTFGSEGVFAFGDKYIQLPTDSQRINELKSLIEEGFIDHLLISQDICYQMAKRSWGGWGMAHILDTLVPRFLAAGITQDMLNRMMRENPARLLAFT